MSHKMAVRKLKNAESRTEDFESVVKITERKVVMKKTALLLALVVASASLVAADIVAKFESLEVGACSGAFRVETVDRTVTSPADWPVSDGVTVVLDYSDFSVSSGDAALVSFKQSNKAQKNLVGLGTRNGKFHGIYDGGMWRSSPTGSDVPAAGTHVIS